MSYSINKAQAPTLPTFSEAMIVSTYLLVGLFLLLLFYILQNHARRQLFGGFFADIIFLTAYSLHGSARIFFRIRMKLGVTSMASSAWMYSIHSSNDI